MDMYVCMYVVLWGSHCSQHRGSYSVQTTIKGKPNEPPFLKRVLDDVINAHGDHHADTRVDEGLKVGIIVPEGTVCVCVCVRERERERDKK